MTGEPDPIDLSNICDALDETTVGQAIDDAIHRW